MIIWGALLAEKEENICGVPRQIAMIDKDFIEVICGLGRLHIFIVEMQGVIRTSSLFVNSTRKKLPFNVWLCYLSSPL
jgi:hypothetical protein